MAWLEFVGALVLAAFMWAILQQPTDTLQSEANASADTTAAQTGVEWLGIWTDWLPLFIVLLAVFGLIVTIVIRRGGVFN